MGSLFRDTAAGFFIRYMTKNKFLKYPEELPGFKVPYTVDVDTARNSIEKIEKVSPTPLSASSDSSSAATDVERAQQDAALQTVGSRVFTDTEEVDEGVILVDWYGPDDPENPQNWGSGRKFFVCGLIWCVLLL